MTALPNTSSPEGSIPIHFGDAPRFERASRATEQSEFVSDCMDIT
jgi:hypothetical protein